MTLDSDVVLKVEGLHKKFCRTMRRSMFYGSLDAAMTIIGGRVDRATLRKNEFWALQNASFDLKRGEALGVIGRNGSGKTTLLRIINGIYPPDQGKVVYRGRMGALIAVGAGFHPHLTGKENIFLNGSIIGMSQKEISEKFDEIVDFADIGEFLDAPVATYSSGMTVRLGFAIAIHGLPNILLADEALVVGDIGFSLKCYRKISEYRQSGGAIVLVSHSIQLVRNTCQKVLWLHQGKVKIYGETNLVCDAYENDILDQSVTNDSAGAVINNDPLTKITKVEFLNKSYMPSFEHRVGEFFNIRIHFHCKRPVDRPVFTVSILDPENIQVISNYTIFDGYSVKTIEGEGYLDFIIEKLLLKPSKYRCTITLSENGEINNVLEWHDKRHYFKVLSGGTVSYGIVNPFPKWKLSKQ